MTSLRSSQASGINLCNDDDGLGDIDPENATFLIPSVKMGDSKQRAFLKEIGITGKDIELMTLDTEEDMMTLKNALRLRFPVLMSSIIKVLLFR